MNQHIFSLRKDAPELKSVLLDGTLFRHGENWVALPRERVASPSGVDSIVFEVIRPEGIDRPAFLQLALKAIRFEILALTFLPGLAILLLGLFKNWIFSGLPGGLAWVGALFLHIAVNLLNDVEDHLRLIDLPGLKGGSGVLQKGWISGRKLKQAAYLFLVVGVLLGLPAVFQSPQVLLWIGIIGTLGGVGYSNRPFEMKYRAWGDVAFFILFGPVLTLGFSQAFFLHTDFSVFCLGLFFGCLAEAIYHLNNLQDMEVDLQHRIETWASFLGFKRARHLLLGLYLLAGFFLGFTLFSCDFPRVRGTILVLLSVPPIARLMAQVYKASGPASAVLSSVRFDAAKIHFLWGVLICFGLFAAHLISS